MFKEFFVLTAVMLVLCHGAPAEEAKSDSASHQDQPAVPAAVSPEVPKVDAVPNADDLNTDASAWGGWGSYGGGSGWGGGLGSGWGRGWGGNLGGWGGGYKTGGWGGGWGGWGKGWGYYG